MVELILPFSLICIFKNLLPLKMKTCWPRWTTAPVFVTISWHRSTSIRGSTSTSVRTSRLQYWQLVRFIITRVWLSNVSLYIVATTSLDYVYSWLVYSKFKPNCSNWFRSFAKLGMIHFFSFTFICILLTLMYLYFYFLFYCNF